MKMRINNYIDYLVKDEMLALIDREGDTMIIEPTFDLEPPIDFIAHSRSTVIKLNNIDISKSNSIKIAENLKSGTAFIDTTSKDIIRMITKCVSPHDLFILEK
jgi:hypothetical protein